MSALVAGRRALEIIELLARSPSGKNFGAIEQQLGLSASSLSRLLKMLTDEGWVATDHRRKYVIANRAHKLSELLSGRWSESEIVKPIVDRLAQLHGHSACFAKYANYGFVLIHKLEIASSYHFIDTYRINNELFTNEIGLVLLAHQKAEHANEVVARSIASGSAEGVRERLSERRSQSICEAQEGFVRRIVAPAFADGEEQPIGVVSVAILDPGGTTIADNLRQDVLAAAAEIGRQFTNCPKQTPELKLVQSGRK